MRSNNPSEAISIFASLRNISACCIASILILAGANAAYAEEKKVASEEKKSLSDIFSFSGDLRLRYESVDEEGKDQRNRGRIRARIASKAKASEELDLHFRLDTNTGDPVSSNETLGDGMGGKEIRFARAYFDWHPESELGESHVYGGKMAMPFLTVSDLVWDYDLNPEGVAVSQALKLSDPLKLIANAAAFQAEERSSADDTAIYGGQLALEASFGQKTKALLGGAYYSYTALKGNTLIYDEEDSFGNSTTTDSEGNLLYASDYGEAELIARLTTDIGMPAASYFTFVKNTQADTTEDTGWIIGATLGKASEPSSWQIDYNYRRLEADSAFGLYTDSDSFGGGTNGRGHRISALYQLAKSTQLGATVFASDINISADEKSYTRLQGDIIFKF